MSLRFPARKDVVNQCLEVVLIIHRREEETGRRRGRKEGREGRKEGGGEERIGEESSAHESRYLPFAAFEWSSIWRRSIVSVVCRFVLFGSLATTCPPPGGLRAQLLGKRWRWSRTGPAGEVNVAGGLQSERGWWVVGALRSPWWWCG